MGQNSWRGLMLGRGDKKSVLLKTKELDGGGEKLGHYRVRVLLSSKQQKHGPELMARGFWKVAVTMAKTMREMTTLKVVPRTILEMSIRNEYVK